MTILMAKPNDRLEQSVRANGRGRMLLRLCPVAIVFTVAILQFGPPMGDHEVIVSQIARQMLETGEWIVPHYLDTPFLVKQIGRASCRERV